MPTTARYSRIQALHELPKVRLKKWGAPHAVTPESEETASKQTVCGRRFFPDQAMDPRPRDGICVDCREEFLGHPGRVHAPPIGEMPGPRRDRIQREKRRQKRRWREIFGSGHEKPVSDVARSIEKNPEADKVDGFLKHRAGGFMERAREFGGRLLDRFGGDR